MQVVVLFNEFFKLRDTIGEKGFKHFVPAVVLFVQ